MTQNKIMGPVDYLMVKFPGNKFSGRRPLAFKLEKQGIIRVIDMVFIVKDEQRETANIRGSRPDRRSASCVH